MQTNDFIIWTAKEDEQGSFCDVVSERHYMNVDANQAAEDIESAMRRGDTVADDRTDESERSNWMLSKGDSGWIGYQSKYSPGR